MIDNFSLAISHGLMLIVVWRLLFRPDLDKETPPKPEEKPKGWATDRSRDA